MSQTVHPHKTRRLVMQALYQWDLSAQSMVNVQQEVLKRHHDEQFDRDYFECCTSFIAHHVAIIDHHYAAFCSRKLQDIGPVEKAILRLGSYELAQQSDIAKRIILNECIELAKKFGPTDSYQFINAALDQTAKSLRPLEA